MVQWLRLSASTAGGTGSIPGWETKILHAVAAAAAKSLQLCPTLCDPMDGSPPGSPVPGILQATTLEWAVEQDQKKINFKIIKIRKRPALLPQASYCQDSP